MVLDCMCLNELLCIIFLRPNFFNFFSLFFPFLLRITPSKIRQLKEFGHSSLLRWVISRERKNQRFRPSDYFSISSLGLTGIILKDGNARKFLCCLLGQHRVMWACVTKCLHWMPTNRLQDFICYMCYKDRETKMQSLLRVFCGCFAPQQGNISKNEVHCDFPSQSFPFS